MLAAYAVHDAVVARLLTLGADVGLEDGLGNRAMHWACMGNDDHSSLLALLLDAGASINARTMSGSTPLIAAANYGHARCAALLIGRGGDPLNLDAKEYDDYDTALHWTARSGGTKIVQLLLRAGADPSIEDRYGDTALDVARSFNNYRCTPFLEAALVEPQRTRALFKARALLDAAHATHKARTGAQTKGHPAAVQQQAAIAAAPVYLKERVIWAEELPRVEVAEDQEDEGEQLAACVKYALGLEGGGIVLAEGQEPTVGMLPEVFVELLELMVSKWDPAQKGRPLGEGYVEVGEQDDGVDGDGGY